MTTPGSPDVVVGVLSITNIVIVDDDGRFLSSFNN